MSGAPSRRKTGIPRLIELAGTKKWLMILAILLSVVGTFCQFFPYVCIYEIVAEIADHANSIQLIEKNTVYNWAKAAGYSLVAYGVLTFAGLMCSHIAAFNILYELRVQCMIKLAKMPLGYFSGTTSGKIKKIVSEDIERIELFVAHHIPDVSNAVVFPLAVIIYMFTIDWKLSLVTLAIFIVAIILQGFMMATKKMQVIQEKYLESMGAMNSSLVEYVQGIEVVKVFNEGTDAFERLNKDIWDFTQFSKDITKNFAPSYMVFLVLTSSTLLFLIPISVALLQKAPEYSEYVPTVLLFIILGGSLFFPFQKIMWISGFLRQNSIGVAKIDEILDYPELAEPENPQLPSTHSIEFRNVTFGYKEKKVIEDISFFTKEGSITALVGPSGGGKSTIAMLTARFWDVNAGSILIGGVPVKDMRNEDLMNIVSFVFQENMLFFDTIEENIRMGDFSAPFEKVVEAAKAAQCHTFIEKLEHGYQTLVGEGGTYLSGGEQQRIALARAILKNSPIVLLDEATAFADPENEGKILESFSKLIRGKTVIVIAHRLSTIVNSDQILVVDDGGIIERGTHSELIELKGRYSHMWDTYSLSRDWALTNN